MNMNNTAYITRNATGFISGWLKLAACLIALTVATAAFAGSSFSSIVVFGDSLSDTGRLFRLTHGGFPPRVAYYEGRQSNGPVWVEYLADRLDLEHRVKNYAVIGAMTGPSLTVPSGNVWSDTYTGLEGTSLRGQFSQFLTDTGGKVDPEALYIIEGGGNDLIGPVAFLLLTGASPDQVMLVVQQIAQQIVINVTTIAGTLKGMGAQHIAVVNVPDFGMTPRLVRYGPDASAAVSGIVALVNDGVADYLDVIDASGGNKIARINAFGFIDDVTAAPAKYGFTNVSGAFMTLDRTAGTVTYAVAQQNKVSQWFFWDDLHPTTRGHQFFAANALKILRAAFPEARGRHGEHEEHGDDR